MTDEFKLLRDNDRGARAKSLLENELLTEAFAELEKAYMSAWRSTMIDDTAGREKLFLAVNIVGKVREHINNIVINGKLAATELQEIAKLAERKKRFGIIG